MFTVINPGFFTTVQDEGRWGYQAYGMPVAGAMDRYAFRTANLLVGNKTSSAVIEMTILGAAFKFDHDQLVAICGADMQATLDGNSIENWSAFVVPKGKELKFDYALTGCRAYLAVRGGIDVPSVLGSRSTYTRAKVGGFEGRALIQGDVLEIGQEIEHPAGPHSLDPVFIPPYEQHVKLRVLLGPQDNMFSPDSIAAFFKGEYTVTDEADRMGYRLDGPKIAHLDKADIISDALCLGAIQIPAHGMPIVMMADRQTTGGYAKIGTVIGPDLRKLAQAKPGDIIHFEQVDEPAAVEALRDERRRYLQIAESFQPKISRPAASTRQYYQLSVNGVAYSVDIEEIV